MKVTSLAIFQIHCNYLGIPIFRTFWVSKAHTAYTKVFSNPALEVIHDNKSSNYEPEQDQERAKDKAQCNERSRNIKKCEQKLHLGRLRTPTAWTRVKTVAAPEEFIRINLINIQTLENPWNFNLINLICS